jgi:hypothetical protein
MERFHLEPASAELVVRVNPRIKIALKRVIKASLEVFMIVFLLDLGGESAIFRFPALFDPSSG